MKATVFILCTLLVFTSAWSQVPVLYYDFESNAARTTLETTPEQSINTGSSIVERYYNPPTPITIAATGNGLAYGGHAAGTALTSNKWPTGDPGVSTKDYYSLNTSTVGFSGLTLSFDARADQSGLSVAIAWGTGLSGAAPTVYTASATGALTVPANGFSQLQFTLPATAENQAELYIKIYAFNQVNSVATTLTIDNLSLNATTISATKTLLDYAAVGSSLTSGTAYEPTYNNLAVSGPGSVVTLGGNLKLQGTLNLAAGTLALGSGTLFMNGTITKTGGLINATTGTMAFGGSLAQTISPAWFTGAIKNLTINNAQGVTATGDLTVSSALALTTGTFALGTTNLSLGGAVSRGSGAINATAGTVSLNGTTAQTIGAGIFAGSIKNLTINNTAGVTTATDATITGTLSLTTGTYNTTTSTQTITGTISRAGGTMNAAAGTLIFNGSAAQTIPAGSISTAIKNLTVNNTAGLTVNDNFTIATALALQAGFLNLNNKTLTIGGTVSGTGTFRGSSSSGLSIASANTVGSLNFDQANDGSTNALASLVLSSGTATLGSKLNIYSVLNIAGGSLDLAAKNLVLKSNATQTAYVAEIRGTLSGETNVTVERYIPAWSTRRWRLLTAPVSNTSINAAWQEGSSWNGTGTLAATGYGTLITGQQQGTAATANANGFDFWGAIANGSCSLRSYTPGTTTSVATWQNVSSTLTANAFNNSQAYLLFIRGDRSVYTGSSAGVTTLRPNGTLKKGTVTISVPKENSHTLVGNPYASPLDFKAVYDANSTKIKSSFYTWQSSLGTGSGGYVLMRPVTPGSSQYEAIPGNGNASPANRLIHSGEGFFVVPATTATESNAITIQESHKSTGTPGTQVFRQLGAEDAKLYVNLYDGAGDTRILLDGVLSQYNENYGMTAGDNIAKAANSTENFSIQKGTADAIVSSAALPKAGDTLKFRLWNTTYRTYQLEVKSTSFINGGLTAVLVDRFLKKETLLNLAEASTSYTFSVTGEAASKDPSRFYIVFSEAKTLPLSVTAIKAEARTTNEVRVQWKVADESEIKDYQVERSVNAVDYFALATQGTTAGAGEKDYEYIDKQPAATSYYRIRLLGMAGEIKYSSVVKVQLQGSNQSVAVYPNPVSGGVFNLSLQKKPKGLYTITLYNMAGQQVLRKEWQHNGGTVTESIQLRRHLGAGTYSLEVRDAEGKAERLSLSIAR